MGTTQECFVFFWTNSRSNTPCTATYLPSHKTIQVRPTRHAGYCWRSKDKHISDIFQRTPTYACASIGRLARTYIYQLWVDTECSLDDLVGVMDNRNGKRERERERESKWNLCCQRDSTMKMIYTRLTYICIFSRKFTSLYQHIVCMIAYLSNYHGQDATQGPFLSEIYLV